MKRALASIAEQSEALDIAVAREEAEESSLTTARHSGDGGGDASLEGGWHISGLAEAHAASSETPAEAEITSLRFAA